MGQTSDQIAIHIDEQRGRLTQDIRQLEQKAKEVTDWKAQFRKRPAILMGAAFTTGVLLAQIGRRGRARYSGHSGQAVPTPPVQQTHHRSRAMDAVYEEIEKIKSALLGAAADTVERALGEFIPGFGDQIRRRQA